MKKLTRITVAVIFLLLLGYFGYLDMWYHDNQRRENNDIQTSKIAENNQVLQFLPKRDAITVTPSTDLPAYASFPIAKQLMEYDIQLGYKSFNLEAARCTHRRRTCTTK